MKNRLTTLAALLVFLCTAPLSAAPPKKAAAASSDALPTVTKATTSLEKRSGLLTFYLDRQKGKVWLEVPPAAEESGEIASYIYVEGLLTGLGSNPVGLDRGQLSDARLVTLRRVGGRVLIEQPNLKFRALSEDPAEVRAVRESFATSILWAGEVVAQDADGRALVDWTPFLTRDAHEVVAAMKNAGQGGFSL